MGNVGVLNGLQFYGCTVELSAPIIFTMASGDAFVRRSNQPIPTAGGN